jgi:exopolysaccharide biosynthesis protein
MQAEDFWGTAPPVTFSQDETGDHNRLPRLAAGLRPDGTLIIAAIDGRNFDRALGLTLADTARLMSELGCVRATNLDGGSSKRMVVLGHTLDLPTTEILARPGPAPIRPVYTAVLFHLRSSP